MATQSIRSSRPGQRRILDLPEDLLTEVLALLPFFLKAPAQTICWIFNNSLSSTEMGQLRLIILQSTVIIPLLHQWHCSHASVQPYRYPALRTGISAGASCCSLSPPTAISSITSNHSCCCCCCCCCCWGCTASCTSSTCAREGLLEEAWNGHNRAGQASCPASHREGGLWHYGDSKLRQLARSGDIAPCLSSSQVTRPNAAVPQ